MNSIAFSAFSLLLFVGLPSPFLSSNVHCIHGQRHQGDCTCNLGWHGRHCDQLVLPVTENQAITESTTAPSTPTTAPSTPTTAAPVYACTKFATVNSLAFQVMSTNNDATACLSAQHDSPEAFVLDHCNVSNPSLWNQGMHVMSSCSRVPVYSPIAVFVNGVYTPSSDATSGIFLGCLPSDGIRMGMQTCDTFPTIIHAENTTAIDPRGFYTIQ